MQEHVYLKFHCLMSCWFQALNTLGSTKWRVNKRVLSIVDRIWSSGGRLADLVDRTDVSCHLFSHKIVLWPDLMVVNSSMDLN